MADLDRTVRLFSYGTLQTRQMQIATFGRELEGEPDALPGFAGEMVEIRDPSVVATSSATHHPIIRPSSDPGDSVAGTMLAISQAELEAADAYEVDDYVRIAVRLKSGTEAWVYVSAAAVSPKATGG
jgi:gamma-glutamylcyclotransferase (GGCT)/AIG2-like uncharacterized protein YtfP